MKDFDYVLGEIMNEPKNILCCNDELESIWIDNDEDQSIFKFSLEDYQKLKTTLVEAIKGRSDPSARVEHWECLGADSGAYTRKRIRLLKLRRNI